MKAATFRLSCLFLIFTTSLFSIDFTKVYEREVEIFYSDYYSGNAHISDQNILQPVGNRVISMNLNNADQEITEVITMHWNIFHILEFQGDYYVIEGAMDANSLINASDNLNYDDTYKEQFSINDTVQLLFFQPIARDENSFYVTSLEFDFIKEEIKTRLCYFNHRTQEFELAAQFPAKYIPLQRINQGMLMIDDYGNYHIYDEESKSLRQMEFDSKKENLRIFNDNIYIYQSESFDKILHIMNGEEVHKINLTNAILDFYIDEDRLIVVTSIDAQLLGYTVYAISTDGS